ncbi:conserved exported hypothetical protein [Tenacibaculum litopenaei]|uniref:porin family protein n=1 Tax=Tenacibaculum litopenaei TaxID=396016 RepID=UPI0038939E52
MKKLLVVAAIALGLSSVNAQETSFGVTGGLNLLTVKLSTDTTPSVNRSTTGTGYYAGFFADFTVSDKFHVQPELLFTSSYDNGTSANTIAMPIMAKYYVKDNFSVQAGPMLDLVVDDASPLVNKFGVGLAAGLGYDISEKVFVNARYSFGLSNRVDSDIATSKFDYLNVGFGFRF